MSKTTTHDYQDAEYRAPDPVAEALERMIGRARFGVDVDRDDESYGYLVDRFLCADDERGSGKGPTVLTMALPMTEVARRRDEMRQREWRYLLAKGDVSYNYFGFGAAVVDRLGSGVGAVLVQVPREHADWQLMRLRSGLQTVMLGVFPTAAAAIAAYNAACRDGYA